MQGKITRRLARYLSRCDAQIAGKTAVVTFTFDDAYSAACNIGADIIESGGGYATYYVCGGFDQCRSGGQRYHTAADLRRLELRGHEIACHGFAHLNYQETPSDEIQRDLQMNAAYLQENGIRTPRNFAYPYGCVSPRVKSLCAKHFRSLRGVQPAANRGTIDLSLLKSVPLYSSTMTTGELTVLVEQTRDDGGWLIFFGHDVTNQPSQFDMTPDLLSFAVSETKRCKLPILSLDTALDHFEIASNVTH